MYEHGLLHSEVFHPQNWRFMVWWGPMWLTWMILALSNRSVRSHNEVSRWRKAPYSFCGCERRKMLTARSQSNICKAILLSAILQWSKSFIQGTIAWELLGCFSLPFSLFFFFHWEKQICYQNNVEKIPNLTAKRGIWVVESWSTSQVERDPLGLLSSIGLSWTCFVNDVQETEGYLLIA